MHSIKCLRNCWLNWHCGISYTFFFICWILKVVVFRTCLQQSDIIFVTYGEHLSGFCFCIFLFLTLAFPVLLLPINSLWFLFRLNDFIGLKLNISFWDSVIVSKFLFFRITLLMFWQKRLYINVSRMRLITLVTFSLSFNVDLAKVSVRSAVF